LRQFVTARPQFRIIKQFLKPRLDLIDERRGRFRAVLRDEAPDVG
jgi:hypothetical protein